MTAALLGFRRGGDFAYPGAGAGQHARIEQFAARWPSLRSVYRGGDLHRFADLGPGRHLGHFLGHRRQPYSFSRFIPAGASVREFSFLLGVWFALETGAWLGAVVLMVDRGVGWLSRPQARPGSNV
jgi:hypothetical protein